MYDTILVTVTEILWPHLQYQICPDSNSVIHFYGNNLPNKFQRAAAVLSQITVIVLWLTFEVSEVTAWPKHWTRHCKQHGVVTEKISNSKRCLLIRKYLMCENYMAAWQCAQRTKGWACCCRSQSQHSMMKDVSGPKMCHSGRWSHYEGCTVVPFRSIFTFSMWKNRGMKSL